MSAIPIVLVLLLLAVALANFLRNRKTSTEYLPNPSPGVPQISSRSLPRSLFDPPSAQALAEDQLAQLRANLRTRVEDGDYSVLDEAKANPTLYNEVLNALLARGSDVRDPVAHGPGADHGDDAKVGGVHAPKLTHRSRPLVAFARCPRLSMSIACSATSR